MSNLKIPVEVVTMVSKCIKEMDTEQTRQAYREGKFPNADKVNDLNKRYRHDLLNASITALEVCRWYDDYKINDSHIDSMLRSIVPTL